MSSFENYFDAVQRMAHAIDVEKGWYEEGGRLEPGQVTALIHTEVAEVTEAYRLGNPPSEKIPLFSCVEEELADIVIRVMDHAEFMGYRLSDAILEKLRFNKTRPTRKEYGKLF